MRKWCKLDDNIRKAQKTLRGLSLSYVGGKRKLLSWLIPILERETLGAKMAFDGFSGSGVVSTIFATLGLETRSCDALHSSYCLAATLIQNPNETIEDDELEWLISHRCVDGEIIGGESSWGTFRGVNDELPGILTTNESLWLEGVRLKLLHLSPYKQLIGHCVMRTLSLRVPFGTPNRGVSTFAHRVKQKDQQKKPVLGHYLNSSYEIEVVHWFGDYVHKFNEGVRTLSELRMVDGIANRGDTFTLFDDLGLDASRIDIAYFDPPYGGKSKSDYNSIYALQEGMLKMGETTSSIHMADEGAHRRGFERMIEISAPIPKIIFSYDSTSWTTIDELCGMLRDSGRTVRVETRDHEHGKASMTNRRVVENLIIAEGG